MTETCEFKRKAPEQDFAFCTANCKLSLDPLHFSLTTQPFTIVNLPACLCRLFLTCLDYYVNTVYTIFLTTPPNNLEFYEFRVHVKKTSGMYD